MSAQSPANEPAPVAAMSLLQDPLAAKQCFAWTFTCVICVGLACAYRKQGWTRVALIYFWLASLVATQMSVHHLLRHLGFPYAAFLTFIQFAALSVPSLAILSSSAHVRPGESATEPGIPFLSLRFVGVFCRRVLPVVSCHTIATVANNMSLGLIDPGLNAVLGSMTPAITIIVGAFLGERLGLQAWMAVGLVVFGGILAIQGGVEAAAVDAVEAPWRGIGLSCAAMLLRSLKNVAIQRSVRGRSEVRAAMLALKGAPKDDPILTPVQLLLFQAPAAALMLLALAAADPAGLSAPLRVLGLGAAATARAASGLLSGAAPPPSDVDPRLLPVLVLNVLCAASLNLCSIAIVQRIGATAMQIVGKANVFITLAASAAYMGETVTPTEVVGALIVLIACYLFPGAPRPGEHRAAADVARPQPAAETPTSGNRERMQEPLTPPKVGSHGESSCSTEMV